MSVLDWIKSGERHLEITMRHPKKLGLLPNEPAKNDRPEEERV